MPPGPPIQFDLDEVVQKAMMLFWQKGYQPTSIDELVKATGVAKSGLYRKFGGKRKLFLAAMRKYVDLCREKMFETLVEGPPGKEGVRQFLLELKSIMGAGGQAQGLGCFATNTVSELGCSDEELTLAPEEHFSRLEAAFKKKLKEDPTYGGENRRPADLAKHLTTMVQGACLAARGANSAKRVNSTINVALDCLK